MQISFYTTTSEKNALSKGLTSPTVISGTLKEPCDMMNPSITVQYYPTIYNFNYVFIAEFNRYYFIENVRYVGKTIELDLHEDVLMSHRDNILNSYGTITRGNKGSKYLNDSRIKNTAQHTLTHRKIGEGFAKADDYVIVLAGRTYTS